MIKEDFSKFIDDNHKNSFIKYINDVAVNLNRVISEISENVNYILECTKNEMKVINDAKNTAEQILGILESSEENFEGLRQSFLNSYDSWLNDCSTHVIVPTDNQTNGSRIKIETNGSRIKIETIIEVEDDDDDDDIVLIGSDSDREIEIVNEVKYLDPNKIFRSNDNLDQHVKLDSTHHFRYNASKIKGDLQACNDPTQGSGSKSHQSSNWCNNILEKVEKIEFKEDPYILLTQSNSNERYENQGKVEKIESKEDPYILLTQSNSNERYENQGNSNADYSSQKIDNLISENFGFKLENCETDQETQDHSSFNSKEELNLECFVRLERLSNETSNHSTTCEKKSKLSDADRFMRLIDLSALERKAKKRSRSLSGGSVSSTSSSCSKKSQSKKKKTKRQKICSSDSDISSYYESSDDNDSEDEFGHEEFDHFYPEEMDDIEREAKLRMLADSDTSESSDEEKDSDDEDQNCQSKKILTKKNSKSSGKTNYEKPAWLNDPLLKFKLPSDSSHEKTSLKDENGLESSNSNDDTLISKSDLNQEKNKRKRRTRIIEPESSDSSSSEDSQIVGNHLKSLGHSKPDQPNQLLEVATPNKKTGRRNIRKVLDDQDITESTKLAVKDEEGRLERLTSRKEQLSILAIPETSVEHSLTLDVDKKTRQVLVAVDRGLVELLKPHQKDGVRFMWDSCFESLEQVQKEKGSGCILAHCMGLGKTLQIITLVHTLLANPAIPIKTVMIVCPMNTIVNWMDEFSMWLKHAQRDRNMNRIVLTQSQKMKRRIKRLAMWQKEGGVLIISYEMLRSLTSEKKKSPDDIEQLRSLLLKPGADLVVCDEGHLLKNKQSQLANRIQQVETQRRIILTGTPLQNNLDEYHCMVQFVKPHLLGSQAEFDNRFANPIKNGQFDNSTEHDVKLMKHRAHVLHRLLEGCVQRNDYEVLKPYLPPKQEYVISVRLSEKQKLMYQHYISNIAKVSDKHCSLFKNYQEIKRLLAHPKTMQLKALHPRRTKKPEETEGNESADLWWSNLIQESDLEDMSISSKLIVLFGILEDCAKKQDKMLVFSQCLYTLDLIEKFLEKLDASGNKGESEATLSLKGEWKQGLDYLRLDGKVRAEERSNLCKSFNDPTDTRLRLFLISTKAGGLGINLTGANRVVMFDPSWNPSSDLQSIFRVFRFGQEKPCYVYRFLTAGTMEEKIYNRQVTKLCMSLRVVDEQQVGRHYRDSDLMELYKLEPLTDEPTLLKPKDDVLAEVLSKYGKYVYNVHEHDSLLVNQEEEQLNEEERKQAWLEYQQEKERAETKAQSSAEAKAQSSAEAKEQSSAANKEGTATSSDVTTSEQPSNCD